MNGIVEWKVSPVRKRKERFCFEIKLQLADQIIKRQNGGYLTSADASSCREQVIRSLSRGDYAVYGDTLVEEYYKYWLKEIKKPMLAYHSYNSYKNCIKNYICPSYGKMAMENMTKMHLKRIYQKTYEKSPSIARVLKTVLSDSMKYAKRHGYVSEDFVAGMKWSRAVSNRIMEKPNKKALTVDEIKQVLAEARDTDLYLPIMFSVFMGLRRSEVVGLKYTDIDYERRKLYIRRQLGVDPSVRKLEVASKTFTKQKVRVKTPSSKRKLEMPLCVFQAVMDERVRYEKRRSRRKKEFQDMDYIYSSSYGRPRTSNYLWKKLHDFIVENDLPYTTWRSLRYTYTTTVLKAGFDLTAISRTLGHTQKEFTADTYVDMKELIRGETYFKNSDEVISNATLNYPLTDEMKMLLEICEY